MNLRSISAVLAIFALPVFAEATGGEIKATIEGNTVQGGIATGEAC
ncbi:MAG: hypothetical protein AAF922_16315 [Pseudomonadota bacterium]